jgi:hypothetical protein
MSQQINTIAASPDLTPVLERDGTLPEAISPAAFAGRIKDELGQWKQIATEHKIVAVSTMTAGEPGRRSSRTSPLPPQVQSFPRRSKTIRMTTMTPTIPLGPYPQLLLCPHVGITPTKARIRMIRRMVPILMGDSLKIDFAGTRPRQHFAHWVDLLSVRWRT